MNSFFYGWLLIPIAWLVYGFGISPGYYSYGQFGNDFKTDLNLTAEQFGLIFGVFTFLYSGVGPLVGIAQTRIGLRAVMTAGSLMAALGFFIMSRADTVNTALIGFSVLGGAGIGFSTIIPCQTLASNWFLKYRARAIAIIFTAGGIVGMGVPLVDSWVLHHYTWREGWLIVSAISFAIAIVCALFVRNTPESIGQFRDGQRLTPLQANAPAPAHTVADGWTAKQAIRTPQFALIVLAACAYAVPWGVIIPHGKLHLGNVGIETEAVKYVYSTMIFVSIFGRFSGSLGDYLKPQIVLAASVLLETIGIAGFLVAETKTVAVAAGVFTGLGFGAAYISVPVVFADYFGRQAFGSTSGTRIFITGILNAAGPVLAGRAFDQLGSYSAAFIGLIILGLAGTAAALFCPHPGPPPQSRA